MLTGAYGCAILKGLFDNNHNRVEQRLYDADRKLMIGNDSYAVKQMEYDHQGNLVRATYLDENNEPVVCEKGDMPYRNCPGTITET